MIRLAVMAPFSSPEAVVAGPLLEAARHSAYEAGRALGVDVEVAAVDDHRDATLARVAFDELLRAGQVDGVIGPKNSGTALAVARSATDARIPLLLPCATADELTSFDTVFRMCATDAHTVRAATRLFVRLGVNRIAVIEDDTPYGRNLATGVRAAATRGGLQVVGDFSRADAAFFAMGEVEQADQLRAARSGGFEGITVGAEGGPNAPLPALAGPSAEGHWLLYAGAPAGTGTVYAAEAADAATALVLACACAVDRPARLAALRATSFDGRSGRVEFDERGERVGINVSVYRVIEGAARLTD